MTEHKAADLSRFIDSVCMNVHFQQGWQYGDRAQTVAKLKALGITHCRDHTSDATEDAAKLGLRFTLLIGPGWNPTDVPAYVASWLQRVPNSVVAIEGPNETNNWPVNYQGKTGIEAAQAFQRELYRAVKANPATKNIPVVAQTSWPVYQNDCDIGNIHAYSRSGNFLTSEIANGLKDEKAANPGKPIWMTEAGYHTRVGTNYHEGVNEPAQAKLILAMLLSAFKAGVDRTFIYQLLDQYEDPNNQESFFGLIAKDWREKPAFHALRNFMAILRRHAGGTAPGGTLDFTLEGLPANAFHLLFENGFGDKLLAVWAEPDIWNQESKTAIAVPAARVTLKLAKPVGNAVVYYPVISDAPGRTVSSTDAITFDLSDEPVVLKLAAAVVAAPTPQTPPIPEPKPPIVEPGPAPVPQPVPTPPPVVPTPAPVPVPAEPTPKPAEPVPVPTPAPTPTSPTPLPQPPPVPSPSPAPTPAPAPAPKPVKPPKAPNPNKPAKPHNWKDEPRTNRPAQPPKPKKKLKHIVRDFLRGLKARFMLA